MREKIKMHPLGFVLIWMGLYLIGFYITGHILTPRYAVSAEIDAKIPFCAPFIIFYKSWFFYFPGMLIYYLKHYKKEYFELAFVMLTGMTLSVIFYVIFPNCFPGRPSDFGTDIFSDSVRNIYKTDPATNAFPSIHAGSSLAVLLVTLGSSEMRNHRFVIFLCSALTTLISLSTLFIKQHSIIDVIGGFVLNAVLYLVYCRTKRGQKFILTFLEKY